MIVFGITIMIMIVEYTWQYNAVVNIDIAVLLSQR